MESGASQATCRAAVVTFVGADGCGVVLGDGLEEFIGFLGGAELVDVGVYGFESHRVGGSSLGAIVDRAPFFEVFVFARDGVSFLVPRYDSSWIQDLVNSSVGSVRVVLQLWPVNWDVVPNLQFLMH